MWYWTKILFLVFIGAMGVWLAYEFFTFPDISKLRTENPQTTSMIEYKISNFPERKKYLVSEIERLRTQIQSLESELNNIQSSNARKRSSQEENNQIKDILLKISAARKELNLNQIEVEDMGDQPKKNQIWMPLEQISPHLQRAVIAGEDSHFFTHDGFDWNAIQKAWEEAQRQAEEEAKKEGTYDPDAWIPPMPQFKRGASTITQQLVKNLYLSEERSFIRKGREAIITYFLERELSKRRILEIYLNVIEWGNGIYGAEAAASTYFKKSASDLTAQEAAYLSAMIPSPLRIFNPRANSKRVASRQRVILRGMNHVKLAY